MFKKYYKIIISSVLILSLSFAIVSSLGIFFKEEVSAADIHLEFKCKKNDCPGDRIFIRVCLNDNSACTPGFDNISDLKDKLNDLGWGTSVDWSKVPGILECEDYEICTRAFSPTQWKRITSGIPHCECEGKCLADPVRDGKNDPPELQESGIKDGIDFVDPNNDIFLPASFHWLEVEGAKSYNWRATPNPLSLFSSTTNVVNSPVLNDAHPAIPPHNPPTDYTPDSCSLQSANNYIWKVQPCCSAYGTNCKPWVSLPDWNFSTSLAPELLLPLDPDWNNSTSQATASIPVLLDWCDPPDNKDYLGSGEHGDYLYDEGRGDKITHYRLKVFQIDSSGNEECHPFGMEPDGSCGYKEIIEGSDWPFNKLYSQFEDAGGQFFIEDTDYRWMIATCYLDDDGNEICSDYSQKWGFSVGDLDYEFRLVFPVNDTVNQVGLPLKARWTNPEGMNSFIYEIVQGGASVISGTTTQDHRILNFPEVQLDTVYSWRVKPCTNHNADPAGCKDWIYSPEWQFKITGVPPTTTAPANGALDIVLPAKIEWEEVSGAKSYRYKITKGGTTIKEELVRPPQKWGLVGYPELKMNNLYSWQVQTCADEDGNICGLWSAPKTFRTFQMTAPVLQSPANGSAVQQATEIIFKWDSLRGAQAYEYEIIYPPTGSTTVHKIITSNSARHISVDFPETGVYNWKVRGCLDTSCDESNGGTGPWSPTWNVDIDLVADESKQGGLVPCGRTYDDPNTPWNEREQCQIHHFFLLIRNVVEFILWKVATILLILSLIVLAAILYLSAGDERTINKVKSLIRSVIIGYLIILFAWLIINTVLALAGFNFQLFGNWWELKF